MKGMACHERNPALDGHRRGALAGSPLNGFLTGAASRAGGTRGRRLMMATWATAGLLDWLCSMVLKGVLIAAVLGIALRFVR